MTDAIKCLACPKFFVPRTRRQRCCSSKCGQAWKRSLPENKEKARAKTKAWYAENRDRARARMKEYRKKQTKPPREGACKKCGNPFLTYAKIRYFCNSACRTDYYKTECPEKLAASRERYREKGRAKRKANYYKTRAHSPWRWLLLMAKTRAKKKGIPFDLTKEWAASRWDARCEMSGLPFELGRTRRGLYSPSIDRIDSTLGYTQDNCRFILWAINAMKELGTDADVLKIIAAITQKLSLDAARFPELSE